MHRSEVKKLEALVNRLGDCKERMEVIVEKAGSGDVTRADLETLSREVGVALEKLHDGIAAAIDEATSDEGPIGWFKPEEDDSPDEADGCGPEDYIQGSIDKLHDAISAYACIESHMQTAANLAKRSLLAWEGSSRAADAPETRVYPIEVELCYHKVVGVKARSEAEALEAASQYGTADLEPDDSCRIEGDDPTIAPEGYLGETSKILQA